MKPIHSHHARPLPIASRRRFLQALGLGGLATATGVPRIVQAGGEPSPQRMLLFCMEHGFVWNQWHMPIPGVPASRTAIRDLRPLTFEEMSPSLRPFHAMRDRIVAVEGLANTSVISEWALHAGETGIDFNNHTVAWAHFLTATAAVQRPGTYCSGGGISIDQEIGRRTRADGRFGALVWGVSNGTFSYSDRGVLAAGTDDPARIYADLLGLYVPPTDPTTPTRQSLIAGEYASAIDTAAREYEFVLPRLGLEGRRKLEQHRDLLRDIERSLGVGVSRSCSPEPPSPGHVIDQYASLAVLAFACDLTRVITLIPPMVRPEEFGYPVEANVHSNYAHNSVDDGGETFNSVSQTAMNEYAVWYGRKVVSLLEGLDAVSEGGGSLLSSTAVVMLPELGSPTHQHHDAPALICGGDTFFRSGRYVRYARDIATPFPADRYMNRPFPASHETHFIGPSRNQLFVTLLRSFGFDDTSFGMSSVDRLDGTVLPMHGTLAELHL